MANPETDMNEETINIYNAIAFPPVQAGGRTNGDPLFTRANDPVLTAISREFGRLGLLLLLTVCVVVTLAVSTFQSLSPAAGHDHHAALPGHSPAPNVASARANPSQR